jgi:hypothetical protein
MPDPHLVSRGKHRRGMFLDRGSRFLDKDGVAGADPGSLFVVVFTLKGRVNR